MSVYHRPADLQEAIVLLRGSPHLTVLAGATDIYPARTARAAWGARDTPDVLDISNVDALRGIADRGDHWWIGALTTWSEIARAELPPLFDGLKAAAREIGGAQIQNRGTIGGNICTASPAGDSIPCLLALDATIELVSDAVRLVPSAQFFTGYRQTARTGSEIVGGIRIPKLAGGGAFGKLGARRYLVISIAMIAAVVDLDDAGSVRSARIAVGACAATPQRLPELERALIGRRLDAGLVTAAHFAHLAPIDDIRASAAYRRDAALQLTRDVIKALSEPRTEAAGG